MIFNNGQLRRLSVILHNVKGVYYLDIVEGIIAIIIVVIILLMKGSDNKKLAYIAVGIIILAKILH